jgi:Rad3-related DNA helicase
MEMNCKYENFQNGLITREKYLKSLQKCVNMAKKPILVHITSFNDLPNGEEAIKYGLSLMTQEKLKEVQKEKTDVKKFKNKEIDILYSTKCNRGVDFPGDVCNSIILTRYPYPNVSSIFWRVLRKTKPENYYEFYIDKSRREFLQRIYRGLRSKNDHIYLLSPDIRVLDQEII